MDDGTENDMGNGSGPVNESYMVSTLVRGMKILSVFSVERPALKVSDIAGLTHLDKATVFRFVYTLTQLGYLTLDSDTKRYRLAVRMLSLVLPAREGIPVRQLGLPVMMELSRTLNESLALGILDGVDVVIIGSSEVSYRLVFPTQIGQRLPVYCTAMGKVLLAYQPDQDWDKLIARINFVHQAQNTITEPAKLRSELENIRKQGYSTEESELITGLNSLAVPILERSGKVAGALTVSSLSREALFHERKDYFVDELTVTARTISAHLDSIS